MGSICGILGWANSTVSVNDVHKMLFVSKHRGPAYSRICAVSSEHNILLDEDVVTLKEGNECQLSIGCNALPIEINGIYQQPYYSKNSGIILAMDGEIYNKEELTKDSNCGLLDAMGQFYLTYGISKLLKKLNGTFVLVVIDLRKNKLYLARDRFGCVPIHLATYKDGIAFASELKALVSLPDFDRSIHYEGLYAMFGSSYPSIPLFESEIYISPGSYRCFDLQTGRNYFRKYFNINDWTKHTQNNSFDLVLCNLEKLLKESIEKRTQLEGMGIQLSGGIDSTLVAKYAVDDSRKNEYPVAFYSLVNRFHPQFSEEKWIDYAADTLGVTSHKTNFDVEIFLKNYEHTIYAYERVCNFPSPLGIFEFSSRAKDDISCLLCGDGSDEMFGGYNDFGVHKESMVLGTDAFFRSFDTQISQAAAQVYIPKYERNINPLKEQWDSLDGSWFDRLRKLFLTTTIPSAIERQNKICMYHSIQCRFPFLDNNVISYALSLPEKYLLHRKNAPETDDVRYIYDGKYALKLISANIFGEMFAFRNKQNIRMPIQDYIRDPRFMNYVNTIIIPKIKERAIFDANQFLDSWNHLDDSNIWMLWRCINLEVWMQLFVDGRMPISIK